jgi:hypothetical protein
LEVNMGRGLLWLVLVLVAGCGGGSDGGADVDVSETVSMDLAETASFELWSDQLAGGESGPDLGLEDATLEPLCEAWIGYTCKAFHACGMMQAVEDCDAQFQELCLPANLPTNPGYDCEALVPADLRDCLQNLVDHGCHDLIFETLRDIPGCAPFDACFGWPM